MYLSEGPVALEAACSARDSRRLVPLPVTHADNDAVTIAAVAGGGSCNHGRSRRRQDFSFLAIQPPLPSIRPLSRTRLSVPGSPAASALQRASALSTARSLLDDESSCRSRWSVPALQWASAGPGYRAPGRREGGGVSRRKRYDSITIESYRLSAQCARSRQSPASDTRRRRAGGARDWASPSVPCAPKPSPSPPGGRPWLGAGRWRAVAGSHGLPGPAGASESWVDCPSLRRSDLADRSESALAVRRALARGGGPARPA